MVSDEESGWRFRAVQERLSNAKKIASLEEEFKKIDPTADEKIIKSKIHHVEHHRSHLASAFFASPFDEAAILSIDGSGDFTTTMTATGKGNQMQVLDSVDFPHSVGLFYTAFTQLLGFPHYGDEYKVMGLAPYGEPKWVEKLKDVLVFDANGLFHLNQKYFRSAKSGIISYGDDHIPVVAPLYSSYMLEQFGAERKKDEPLNQYHKDLGASVQRITELLIFHILNALQKKTGLKNVCIAGGVAQNSVANGKLTRNTGLRKYLYTICRPRCGHFDGFFPYMFYNQVLKQPQTVAGLLGIYRQPVQQ